MKKDGTTLKKRGRCRRRPYFLVTRNIRWVCGNDGVSYVNKSSARYYGVSIKHKGKCDPTKICDDADQPVCGRDDRTYKNRCYAKVLGVRIAHNGRCDGTNPPPVCPAVYAPVCGVNGRTYGN